jgi:hypothetical protein
MSRDAQAKPLPPSKSPDVVRLEAAHTVREMGRSMFRSGG